MRIYTGLFIIHLLFYIPVVGQQKDSINQQLHLHTAFTVTNNGISLIPTFSLGKPALITDLSIGKRKIFFEPQLRFALDGNPWSFIFWWRYKAIRTRKASLTIGAHPALNFRSLRFTENGVEKKGMTVRRYVAGELTPEWKVSKKMTAGLYFLYSKGIDKDAVQQTHFITVNATFSSVRLIEKITARISPQVFYLYQDHHHGYYCNAAVTLSRPGFPVSLQTILNKSIRSNIPGSKQFVWNISLITSFAKNYVTQK
jgi:hypothetical protein